MTAFVLLLAAISPIQADTKPDVKQLEAWVADLAGTDATRQRAARQALLKTGPNAHAVVPALIKLLGTKGDNRTAACVYAVEVLGAIGPKAKDAVPAMRPLCQPMGYSSFPADVALAIARIDGPKPELTRTLLLSYSKGIAILLASSTYLDENQAAVAKHLLALCDDENADVRQKAALMLGGKRGYSTFDNTAKILVVEVGETDKGVAVFKKLLGDADPLVRIIAADALGRTAPKELMQALPVVVAVLREPKFHDQVSTYPLADVFRPVLPEATKALLPLFDSTDPGRATAIHVLAQLPVRDALIETLQKGTTERTREAAALCLGARYSSDRTTAHAALKAALKDRAFAVRFAAASALLDLTPDDERPAVDGVAALSEGLANNAAEVRAQAARRLARIGPPAAPAVPELRKRLDDRDARVALEVAIALATITPKEAGHAVPVLRRELKNSKQTAATIRLLRVLGRTGAVAKPALPDVTARLEGNEAIVRVEAAEALALIDPTQADKATAVLVEVFQKNRGAPYYAALFALGHLGPTSKSALPVLLASLEERQKKPNADIPSELAYAIMAVDPATPATISTALGEMLAPLGDRALVRLGDVYKQLRERAKPLLGDLVKMLDAKPDYVRLCAIILLDDLGSYAHDALPALRERAAKDSNALVRTLAADAVRRIDRK